MTLINPARAALFFRPPRPRHSLPRAQDQEPRRRLLPEPPEPPAAGPPEPSEAPPESLTPPPGWTGRLRTLQRLALNAVALLGLASVVGLFVCVAAGLKATVVISGSMAPGIPVGAITFHRPVPVTALETGDVVTVPRPDDGTLVTHRVVRITPHAWGPSLTLQGDANQEPDPAQYQVCEAGLVVAVIPYAGHAVLAVQRHPALTLAGLGLITLSALWPIKQDKEKEKP
jgi:signal peptidase